MDKSIWGSNVGSDSHPVTYLHEYAVALLWETVETYGGCFVNTMTGWEQVFKHSVASLIVPTDLQAVGGLVPDLAIYDKQHNPKTIFEVVVTNPPSISKSEKLKKLQERGIQVIVTKRLVSEKDLEDFVRTFEEHKRMEQDSWPVLDVRDYFKPEHSYIKHFMEDESFRKFLPHVETAGVGLIAPEIRSLMVERQREANSNILGLMQNLAFCEPYVRREFFRMMNVAGRDIHARFPISPSNPKSEVLERARRQRPN